MCHVGELPGLVWPSWVGLHWCYLRCFLTGVFLCPPRYLRVRLCVCLQSCYKLHDRIVLCMSFFVSFLHISIALVFDHRHVYSLVCVVCSASRKFCMSSQFALCVSFCYVAAIVCFRFCLLACCPVSIRVELLVSFMRVHVCFLVPLLRVYRLVCFCLSQVDDTKKKDPLLRPQCTIGMLNRRT